jgi:hypothetical protein
MNAVQLASLIRAKTRTTSATFSDADMLVYVNTFKDEIAGRIQQERQDIWNMPATFDLEADKREYAFPDDVLNSIVSLELKFTASGDYVRARALQAPADFALSEAQIAAYHSNLAPWYFVRRRAVYVLSGAITAVTAGGRLVYNAFPASLADLTGTTDLSIDPSTTTHGFPREFHELLARRVSIEYKDINGMQLSTKELAYDQDLERKLDEFSTADLSQVFTASVPDGASMGDEGFDL